MKAFWTYTLARIGVFLLIYLPALAIADLTVGLSSSTHLMVLLAALVFSSAISIFALAGLRNRLAMNLQTRAEAMSERIEASRSAEDID